MFRIVPSTILLTIAMITLLLGTSWALPYQVDFSVSSFSPDTSSVPPPYSSVSGSFVYEASSINSTIDSLTSINLTIGSHVYALSEVGYAAYGSNGAAIGGIATSPVSSVSWAVNDFWLAWDLSTLFAIDFGYAALIPDTKVWFGYVDNFSVTALSAPDPVPEPSTVLLLGCGLVGLAWYGRKRKNA